MTRNMCCPCRDPESKFPRTQVRQSQLPIPPAPMNLLTHLDTWAKFLIITHRHTHTHEFLKILNLYACVIFFLKNNLFFIQYILIMEAPFSSLPRSYPLPQQSNSKFVKKIRRGCTTGMSAKILDLLLYCYYFIGS